MGFTSTLKYRLRLLFQPKRLSAREYLLSPPLDVEVEVDDVIMTALFDRIAAAWSELGRTDPYWSVLSNDEYRTQKFERSRTSFFKTANVDLRFLEKLSASAGLAENPDRICLELGCGVGRVTAELANKFDRVIAVDVSAPHLELAAERIKSLGLTNVEFLHLSKVQDLQNLPAFNFFFSRLVLQHNPPPIIAQILNTVLDRLAPGGLCLFELPVYIDSYRFAVDEYLASPSAGMESHVLPQPYVHSILRNAGVNLITMAEAPQNPSYFSMMFFGQKSSGASLTGVE